MYFWDWVTSPRMIFSLFPFAFKIPEVLLFHSWIAFNLCRCTTFSLFILYPPLSVEGHLCCFQFLDITNEAAVNTVEQMSLWDGGTSFGYIPRVICQDLEIELLTSFLRKHQIDFQSGCTSLQYHQQWRRVLLAPHSSQHVLSHECLSYSDG